MSVIVPIYNTAEYVEECIRSILSQSYRDIEVLLVNDGSIDGSGEICGRYVERPNVTYIEQVNLGATAARRKGVDLAKGEWIMFVDSDDLLLDGAIDKMMSLAADTDLVLAGHTGNMDLISHLPDSIDPLSYLRLIYARDIYVAPFGRLFRRSLFNEKTLVFPRYFTLGEDYLMNLQIAVDNNRSIKVYHGPVYERRANPMSTMHTHSLDFDYCQHICGLADTIAENSMGVIPLPLRIKQRLVFFYLTLPDIHFQSDAHHPFVLEIKRLMNAVGMWRLIDRCLLNVSSSFAVKVVWYLRSVLLRISHPALMRKDVKRVRRWLFARSGNWN